MSHCTVDWVNWVVSTLTRKKTRDLHSNRLFAFKRTRTHFRCHALHRLHVWAPVIVPPTHINRALFLMLKVEGCPSGESPVTPRKRLHSAEDARCSSRPPPEGAGSVSISESEEKGGFCRQCQQKVAELKKQAQALAEQSSLKVSQINILSTFRANSKYSVYLHPQNRYYFSILL